MTFNRIASKQFWHEEHVNRKTNWDVCPPPDFISLLFHSLFYWLTSMKYQNEQDKNRRRPLTPASRFFVFFWVSIEHQYSLNPKENGSQTRPIKSLHDINTVANTANDIRGAECVLVSGAIRMGRRNLV